MVFATYYFVSLIYRVLCHFQVSTNIRIHHRDVSLHLTGFQVFKPAPHTCPGLFFLPALRHPGEESPRNYEFIFSTHGNLTQAGLGQPYVEPSMVTHPCIYPHSMLLNFSDQTRTDAVNAIKRLAKQHLI